MTAYKQIDQNHIFFVKIIVERQHFIVSVSYRSCIKPTSCKQTHRIAPPVCGGAFFVHSSPARAGGFRKAFSFEPVIKTSFDLLKHLAVWQQQVSNKKIKRGDPMGERKELAHPRWNCKYHIVFAPKIPKTSVLQREA